MRKRQLIVWFFCLFIFTGAACSQEDAAPTHTLPAATILAPASPIAPPSLTPTETATVKPSDTPMPTATPTQALPSATPRPTLPSACPGAPKIQLAVEDWVRVSLFPPVSSNLRSSPGLAGEIVGVVKPGENLQIVEGPQCADEYTWWRVRRLKGSEGWTAEGDAEAYWLVEPISAWFPLPAPLALGETRQFDLREIRIAPETSLVSTIEGEYFPLATPMPTPKTAETPWPDDPRASDFGTTAHAEQSFYRLSGAVEGFINIYNLQDERSRFYLNQQKNTDCTQKVRQLTQKNLPKESEIQPFCGMNGRIPIHFKAEIKVIEFSGGKGLRFLISSANYQTVNKLNYIFQGVSDDGKYFILILIYDVLHPYIVNEQLWDQNFGPLLAWKEGQYDQAQESYDIFNGRMEEMLNANAVPLYPALEILDAMAASIEVK